MVQHRPQCCAKKKQKCNDLHQDEYDNAKYFEILGTSWSAKPQQLQTMAINVVLQKVNQSFLLVECRQCAATSYSCTQN